MNELVLKMGMNPTLSDKTISEIALDVLDMEGSELATIDGHYWLKLGNDHTFAELSDRIYHAIIFSRFIKVQIKGKYNMFTEGGSAAKDAKLSLEEYTYVLQNYKELDTTFPKIRKHLEKLELNKLTNSNHE